MRLWWELPFDEYKFFPHSGHLLSRKLMLKDQPYRKVSEMVREMENSCKTGVQQG